MDLEAAARKCGLDSNEKTKYMRPGDDGGAVGSLFEVGTYRLEGADNFIYLGTKVNSGFIAGDSEKDQMLLRPVQTLP